MGIIKISNLTKDYGNGKGVFDLSFEISKGEVFGFLGPNGAGKTTTIRHLMGFLNADKGELFINGLECRERASEIQKSLGYLPGEIAFMDEMTGEKFLGFIAQLRGMTDFSRMKELLEIFELDTSGRLKKMSKGMKQKIGIVCAFMHDPDVLILDEPTSGLDPLMQSRFVELIAEEKSRGKTILMSSHSFEEVDRTCDRVGIIKEGRLVTIEDVATLKNSQRKTYIVGFHDEKSAKAFANEPIELVEISGSKVTATVIGNISQFISLMGKHNVTSLDVKAQTIEELFMHFYGGEKNDK
ncbi:MAG: ABC transporter ATP-binding protein [Oscillospiraceae bacterium]|jgi:ABC-2 type transport system ATP-binding protein